MIRTARVLPGTESPAGSGSTGALRCAIELDDGTRLRAYLKRAPLGQVAAEAFAAVLLRAWGLPTPEPFIVEEQTGPAFASADAAYPNLSKRLGINDEMPEATYLAAVRVAARLVAGMGSAALAAAADEAIDNRDRNLGNILWDGEQEAWVDHAYSLGQHGAMADENKLCALIGASLPDCEAFKSGAIGQALALNDGAIEVAAEAMLPPIDGQALAQRVAQRVGSLASRLLARFPQPADLLSGA